LNAQTRVFETGIAGLFEPDVRNFLKGAFEMPLSSLVWLGQKKRGDCMTKGEAGEVKPGLD
jgi:hypothetical protein